MILLLILVLGFFLYLNTTWILNQFGFFYAQDYQWAFHQGCLHLYLSQVHYRKSSKSRSLPLFLFSPLLCLVQIHIQSFTLAQDSRLIYIDHIFICYRHRTCHLTADSAQLLHAHRPWATATRLKIAFKKKAVHIDLDELEIDTSHLSAIHETHTTTQRELCITVQSTRLYYAHRDTVLQSQSRAVRLVLSHTEVSAARCKISDAYLSLFSNGVRLCQCEMPDLEIHCAFIGSGLKNINVIFESPTLFLEQALFTHSRQAPKTRQRLPLFTLAWILSSLTIVFPGTDQGQCHLSAKNALARILGEPGPPSHDFDHYFAKQEAYWSDRVRRRKLFETCLHLVQDKPTQDTQGIYSLDFKCRLDGVQLFYYANKIQKQVLAVQSGIFRCHTQLTEQTSGFFLCTLPGSLPIDLSLDTCALYLWEDVFHLLKRSPLSSNQSRLKWTLDISDFSISVANHTAQVLLALNVHHLALDQQRSHWTGLSLEHRTGAEPVQRILSAAHLCLHNYTANLNHLHLTYSLTHHYVVLCAAQSIMRILSHHRNRSRSVWSIACDSCHIDFGSGSLYGKQLLFSTHTRRLEWNTLQWFESRPEGNHLWASLTQGSWGQHTFSLDIFQLWVPFGAHLTSLWDSVINRFKAANTLHITLGFPFTHTKSQKSLLLNIHSFQLSLSDSPFEIRLGTIFRTAQQVNRAPTYTDPAQLSRLWIQQIDQKNNHIKHPLLYISSTDLWIELKPSSSPEPAQFLCEQGVPSDHSHAALFPFYLSINSGPTRVNIRDYPLPLLHLPATWKLEAQGILTIDQIIAQSKRNVSLQLLPNYALTITRTVSAVKCYSKIKGSISGQAYINASASYRPALRLVAQLVSALCPLSSDPSPRLGWWDKLRFAYHLSLRIEFEHGLCLVMKGDTSPYMLENVGIASIFPHPVQVLLGEENNTICLSFTSTACLFGLPVLSPATSQIVFSTLLGRLSGNLCLILRLSFQEHRQPHHQVVLKSKQCEETHQINYDAYRHFRSDRLSLLVELSHNPIDLEEINAIYLSPHSLDHLLNWNCLLQKLLSVRIRPELFWPQKKANKLPLHKIQYRITLDSIAIAFCCPYEQSVVGLKLYASKFTLDLQRPEPHLKKISCALDYVDLRTIKASNCPEQSQPVQNDFFVGTFLEPSEPCKHWLDPEDFLLVESKQTYISHQNHPFLFSPSFSFVNSDTTHNPDTHKWQKTYLQHRATDLDQEIERTEQNLATIQRALDKCSYNGYHELISQQRKLSQKIDYLQKRKILLYEYTCQAVLEELNIDTPTQPSNEKDNDFFQHHCALHNPHIILNTSVVDILSHWLNAKQAYSERVFNLSPRCLQVLGDHFKKKSNEEFQDSLSKATFSIDAIYPQLWIQAHKDHALLLTSKSIKTQLYNVFGPSVYLGHKYLTHLNDAQLWIVKRPEVHVAEYGNQDKLHWATWIHPEQFWTHRSAFQFDSFYNTITPFSGKIQLDRLHSIEVDLTRQARTVFTANFDSIHWLANSDQAHAVYHTLLILSSCSVLQKKELQNSLKEMVLTAEKKSFVDNLRHIHTLQVVARILAQTHNRLLLEFGRLDFPGLENFNINKRAMDDAFQKLAIAVIAIRSVHRSVDDIVLPSMKFVFICQKAVWNLVHQQAPLALATFKQVSYDLLCLYDGSRKHRLEIDDMEITDSTLNPVFFQVLCGARNQTPILRLVLNNAPAVAGIAVVNQIHLTLASLQLQISTPFVHTLKEYLFNHSTPPHPSTARVLPKKTKPIFALGSLVKKVKKSVLPSTKPTQTPEKQQKKISFISITVSGADHCVSLRGPYQTTLYNIVHFAFKQPKLHYTNKTWSLIKLTKKIQKGPALIKRKLSSAKQNPRIEITNTALTESDPPPSTTELISLKSDSNMDINRNRTDPVENKA